MKKQHLEGFFSKYIKLDKNLWYLKLQTYPGAHTTNPSDYIVLSKNNKYLIECKETKNKAFRFDRLTQKRKLIEFNSLYTNNKSLILICFWRSNRKKSLFYLIPIEEYIVFENFIPKKSANITEFELYLSKYRVKIEEISKYF